MTPPTAQPMGLFESRTQTRGAYGAYVRGYDSQRSGLSHSAILLSSKYRLTPALVTTGRDVTTNRPAEELV